MIKLSMSIVNKPQVHIAAIAVDGLTSVIVVNEGFSSMDVFIHNAEEADALAAAAQKIADAFRTTAPKQTEEDGA